MIMRKIIMSMILMIIMDHQNDEQADPEQRFTTFVKALQATRLDKEITDYDSEW